MEFLEADHREWIEMWEELCNFPINEGDGVCQFMGKCWEYMGSTDEHHHFRHRLHPRTGKQEFVYLERRKAGVT